MDLVRECGYAEEKTHQETHQYATTSTAWSHMYPKQDLAQWKPTQEKAKVDGAELFLSIHTAPWEKGGTKKK